MMMTAPLPPTSGMTSPDEHSGMQGAVQGMGLQAGLPDLSAMAAEAESAGKAWCAGASDWADSPQGAGLGGFGLSGDHPAGADGDWPVDMSFPHQGP
jgi:hypothetical protein